MRCVIAKVDEIFFDGEAESLTVPGAEGEMTVLPQHEPFITTLKPGKAVLRLPAQAGARGEVKEFPIEKGLLEVHQNGVTVIL